MFFADVRSRRQDGGPAPRRPFDINGLGHRLKAPYWTESASTEHARKGDHMSHRVVVSVSVAAVLVALVLSAAVPSTAQTAAAKKAPVPRTAWGKPDLQGVWDFRTITPLERPQNQAGREFLTEAEAAKLEQAA